MLRILKNQKGFTLIELVIIIILIGVLAAVAIPKYVDLRENAMKASAQATLDAGRAGIMLDFADKVMVNGTYVTAFVGPVDAKMVAADKTLIETFLEASPNYPGTYDSGADEGFRWWLINLGSTTTASGVLYYTRMPQLSRDCQGGQSQRLNLTQRRLNTLGLQ